MKTQDRIQPVRFLICDDPECAGWPTHAYFLVGAKHGASAICLCFSQEKARIVMQEMSSQGMLLPSDVPAINKAISESRLPLLVGQADRLAHFYQDEADRRFFIELIYGLKPPEEGSGETRFELAESRVGQPPHGCIYLRGLKVPVTLACYSESVATQMLDELAKAGLVSDEENARINGQIRLAELPESHDMDLCSIDFIGHEEEKPEDEDVSPCDQHLN